MKCGDRGHLSATGEPCGQVIGHGKDGCIWHTNETSREAKLAIAYRGGLASASRRFYHGPPPEFQTRRSVIAWAEKMAQKVLAGELDTKVADSARGFAALALSAIELGAIERLDKIERTIVTSARRLA